MQGGPSCPSLAPWPSSRALRSTCRSPRSRPTGQWGFVWTSADPLHDLGVEGRRHPRGGAGMTRSGSFGRGGGGRAPLVPGRPPRCPGGRRSSGKRRQWRRRRHAGPHKGRHRPLRPPGAKRRTRPEARRARPRGASRPGRRRALVAARGPRGPPARPRPLGPGGPAHGNLHHPGGHARQRLDGGGAQVRPEVRDEAADSVGDGAGRAGRRHLWLPCAWVTSRAAEPLGGRSARRPGEDRSQPVHLLLFLDCGLHPPQRRNAAAREASVPSLQLSCKVTRVAPCLHQ